MASNDDMVPSPFNRPTKYDPLMAKSKDKKLSELMDKVGNLLGVEKFAVVLISDVDGDSEYENVEVRVKNISPETLGEIGQSFISAARKNAERKII
jgi:hypothetical protein